MPLTHRRRKEIAALQKKKYRDRLGQTVVEGVRSAEAAVEAGAPLIEVVVTEAAQALPRVAALLGGAGVPVHTVSGRELAALSDVETSQGVLAVAAVRYEKEAALAGRGRVLVLDGVQDPGNVGTILRTAAWFGVEAVVAGPGTADLYHPKVVRASMGGVWDVPLGQVADVAALLGRLSAAGFACYGADLEGTPARAWTPAHPSALVLGSEAHGLSAAAKAHLDARVAIEGAPARRGTESLNVAAAAAILMHRWPERLNV